jgi:BirA family biotin operon repressor/biotin-[acetyl-CoA-carboxylase] ligase
LGECGELLTPESIGAGLQTRFVGRNVVYLAEIGSTNEEARRLAEAGAPEGTLVITDHQTAGRGRLSRHWEAPPGSSLLMSLLFRPALAPPQVQRLTMIAGLTLLDAIEDRTGLQPALKWPNDVVVDGAKVAGILTEVSLTGNRIDHAVVGVGLNVNLDPRALPGDLLVPATSLAQALGRPVARLPLLWTFLRGMEARYLALQAGHAPHGPWAERLVTLGRPVVVSSDTTLLEGVTEGVDADGALLVRLADGGLRTVLAGDVSLRPQGASPRA